MFRKSSLMSLTFLACCMAAVEENGGGTPPVATPAPAPRAVRTVEGRVLTDCQYGKCNDLVTLSPADMDSAVEARLVDASKGAIGYARKLEQNQPKPTALE
jgi:hypothetical protein